MCALNLCVCLCVCLHISGFASACARLHLRMRSACSPLVGRARPYSFQLYSLEAGVEDLLLYRYDKGTVVAVAVI